MHHNLYQQERTAAHCCCSTCAQGVAPRGQSGPEYDEHPHIMQLYAGRRV
jgi:hypothetical protein